MLQIYCLKNVDAAMGYLLSFYCVAICVYEIIIHMREIGL